MNVGKELLRQTGRTTRMLEAAKRHYYDGLEVVIVAHDGTYRDCLEQRFLKILGLSELPKEVSVVIARSPEYPAGFNWEAHPNCLDSSKLVVMVDHDVIEKKYAKQLELLHRHDPRLDQLAQLFNFWKTDIPQKSGDGLPIVRWNPRLPTTVRLYGDYTRRELVALALVMLDAELNAGIGLTIL